MRLNRSYTLIPAVAISALAWAAAGDYQKLDGKAEPLRSAFNADLGKVRVVMLVAPT